jgi:hypothetical protein
MAPDVGAEIRSAVPHARSYAHEGWATTCEAPLIERGDAASEQTGNLPDGQEVSNSGAIKGDEAAPGFRDCVLF